MEDILTPSETINKHRTDALDVLDSIATILGKTQATLERHQSYQDAVKFLKGRIETLYHLEMDHEQNRTTDCTEE